VVRSLRSEDRRWRRRIATDGKRGICGIRSEVSSGLHNGRKGVVISARRRDRDQHRSIESRGRRRVVENGGRSGKTLRRSVRESVVDGMSLEKQRRRWLPRSWLCAEEGRLRSWCKVDARRRNLRNVVRSAGLVRSLVVIVKVALSC